jgi:hypothetical protein
VIAVRRLDLDHFRAQIGQHEAAGRAHYYVHEFDDANAFERQPVAHAAITAVAGACDPMQSASHRCS